MTLGVLRALVDTNAAWFAGVHPETPDSLAEAERRLGRPLPASLGWLLSTHGYSTACGVPGLREAVEATERCREAMGLPARFLVLDDKGDAGVVLLDADSPAGRVLWVGEHELARLARGEPVADFDAFADYAAWVAKCLADAKADA